jgi:PAS domain S-box-containing protein
MPYRSVTSRGVTLLCFPPYDEVFAGLAARSLAQLAQPTPDALQASLATAYPRAVVRAREEIAGFGAATVWYAYRDGRYSPYDARRWWEEPGTASIVIDTDGRYVDANEAALALIGQDRDGLLAMVSGDLTEPSVRPTVAWVWELMRQAGELHSTSILIAADGRRVPVEYRLVRDPDTGLFVSYLRAIPLTDAEPALGAADGPSR